MKIVIPLAKVDVHGRHPRYVDVEDAAGRPAAREHLREQSCFWKTKGEGIRRICQCLVSIILPDHLPTFAKAC